MSYFTYKARKANGESYTAQKEAKDRYELYRILKENGEDVISVEEKRKGFSFNLSKISFGKSVKTHDKIIFARNLSSMLTAGLSLSRALSVLERQSKNKYFSKILATLQEEIGSGKTLSESLKTYPKVFSQLFISMVKAGEESGTLSESLKVVAIQMDRTYSLQRKIKGAMMYPSVIVLAMILIAILMLTYIVPTLMKTFTDLEVALPASTRFVLFVSNLVRDQGLLLLAVLTVIGYVFYRFGKTETGKNIIHAFYIKIPLIGPLVKEVNSARTARTMSSLLSSGVDVVESIKITTDVIQNVHYKRVLEQVNDVVKKGAPMSKVFSENINLYPVFVGEMMSVGEETGKIGEMLLGVAQFYEEDVEQKTKDMSTIIEPFLMIVIATAVGFFAVAMISPMYSLVNVI